MRPRPLRPRIDIGIVEAAWRIKPNFVILMPALQEALGKAGLRDLKTRLGEMGRCMIVLSETSMSVWSPAIRRTLVTWVE